MRLTAIVMASGFSRRMQKNKLLIPVNGKPMIQHTLDLLSIMRNGCFSENLRSKLKMTCPEFNVVVVTAYEEIQGMGEERGFTSVWNDHPDMGQSRSAVLGVMNGGECDGYLFFTGDMPFLTRDTVEKVVLKFYQFPDSIIIPKYGNKNGNPVIFPAKLKGELLALTGDAGGRRVIKNHPESVVYVEIEDDIQGMDMDCPQDLKYINEIEVNE